MLALLLSLILPQNYFNLSCQDGLLEALADVLGGFKCNLCFLVHHVLRRQYVLERGNGFRVFAAPIKTTRRKHKDLARSPGKQSSNIYSTHTVHLMRVFFLVLNSQSKFRGTLVCFFLLKLHQTWQESEVQCVY